MIMALTWVHTHLPKLAAGETDCLSVKIPGQHIDYASWVFLAGCKLKVSEPGRQRCIREGVRNVHAWVVGQEHSRQAGVPHAAVTEPGWRQAVYDPFKGPLFVDLETLAPVRYARYVIMSGKNVYYVPYEFGEPDDDN
jgi:hypothetical protein